MKIESVSTTILRISESTLRFLSPHSQFEKLSQAYERIGATGVVDAILSSLQDYCTTDVVMKQQSSEETSPTKKEQI